MENLAAFVMMLIAFAPQERDSLLNQARRNGGKASVMIDVNSPIPDLTILATEAALIVRGSITAVRTRLSDDEQLVVTEYDITPIRFYKGSVVGLADMPGRSKPLVVQRPGGALIIDGLQLSTTVTEFPEAESLRNGEEVIFFLSPAATKGTFRLPTGAFGVYRIVSGQVIPMESAASRSAALRPGDQTQSLALFERRVLDLIRQ
jgi:hypothetical protein